MTIVRDVKREMAKLRREVKELTDWMGIKKYEEITIGHLVFLDTLIDLLIEGAELGDGGTDRTKNKICRKYLEEISTKICKPMEEHYMRSAMKKLADKVDAIDFIDEHEKDKS